MSQEALHPRDAQDLIAIMQAAIGARTPLTLIGAGTKQGWGRPTPDKARRVVLSGLAGIDLYEPDELVLRAGAGTPLAEIQAALSAAGQRLACDLPDWGPFFGGAAGGGSLGGAVSCNHSGPRRLTAGALRDAVLGAAAVTGRGELIRAGGRVVKNVSGFDLPRLWAGAFGTLGALTEITVKTAPRPQTEMTLLALGLDDAAATAAMTAALSSAHEVSAAAHLPAATAATLRLTGSVVALRLEGFAVSVAARRAALAALLRGQGLELETLPEVDSVALWADLRDLTPFVARPELLVWRISVPPAAGAGVLAAIASEGPLELAWRDWGGGLLWIGLSPEEDDAAAVRVRRAVAKVGGHATLLRAPAALRALTPAFHPQPPALAALTRRVRAAFDPHLLLNRGRMAPEASPDPEPEPEIVDEAEPASDHREEGAS